MYLLFFLVLWYEAYLLSLFCCCVSPLHSCSNWPRLRYLWCRRDLIRAPFWAHPGACELLLSPKNIQGKALESSHHFYFTSAETGFISKDSSSSRSREDRPSIYIYIYIYIYDLNGKDMQQKWESTFAVTAAGLGSRALAVIVVLLLKRHTVSLSRK